MPGVLLAGYINERREKSLCNTHKRSQKAQLFYTSVISKFITVLYPNIVTEAYNDVPKLLPKGSVLPEKVALKFI